MKKLKLHERFRLFIQCVSFCLHNGYVRGWLHGSISSGNNKAICVPGLNCYSCPGAVGACPIGSLQAVLDSGKFHISLYVFGFIAGVGVFCGRFACGWLCPFGLIQDLLHRIPIFKKEKNMPGHKKLRWLRFVILVLFVILLPAAVLNEAGSGEPWFCEWICPSGTLLGGIPLLIANPALRPAAGIRFAWKCFVLLAVLVLSIKYYRPFCKYICPLGAMYGVANPISIYRFKCEESDCVKCGACQKACGMDIKVWETPNSIDCIRCGKCLKACPTGALSTTFAKKKTDTEIKVPENKVKANEGIGNEATVNSTESVSKPKVSVGYLILGIIIIVLGAMGTLVSVFYPFLYASQAVVQSDLDVMLFVYVQFFAWTVPAVMLIIFGSCLIRFLAHPEQLNQLREWPVKLLLVWAGSFLAAHFGTLFSYILEGTFDAAALWENVGIILSNAVFAVAITFIGVLLSLIFVRKKKQK